MQDQIKLFRLLNNFRHSGTGVPCDTKSSIVKECRIEEEEEDLTF